MRRPLHRIFNVSSAVSLLLCVIVCLLWVRSYGLTDEVRWRRLDGERSIRSAQGRVLLELYLGDRSDRPTEWFGLQYVRGASRPPKEVGLVLLMGGNGDDTVTHYGRAGFAWSARRNTRRGTLTAHGTLPFWYIALTTAQLPLAWMFTRWRSRVRARRRERYGFCPACGFDCLARPPEAGDHPDRCPACGHMPSDQDRSIMKRIPVIAAFVAGMAVATLLCLVVLLPISNQSVRDGISKEVHSPMVNMLWHIRDNARNGKCAQASEQLILLTRKFAQYDVRGGEGPPPKDWYQTVNATKPTE